MLLELYVALSFTCSVAIYCPSINLSCSIFIFFIFLVVLISNQISHVVSLETL